MKKKVIHMSRDSIQNGIILLALITLVVIFTSASGSFFSLNNFHSILLTAVPVGLIAIGECICIMGGYFEMSVGMIAAMGGLMAADVMNACHSPALTVLVVCLMGAAAGFIAGIAVSRLKMNAFITTFALQQTYRGIIYIWTNGGWSKSMQKPLYDSLTWIGKYKVFGLVQLPVVIMIVIYILSWLVMKYTKLGRSFYLIGNNAKAARICGIDVANSRLALFIYCDILAALAGMLYALRVSSAAAFIGDTYCMEAIAATILGGTSMKGGKGSLLMTFVGIMIIYVIKNGLIMMNIPDAYQFMVIGLILIIAVLAQTERKRD